MDCSERRAHNPRFSWAVLRGWWRITGLLDLCTVEGLESEGILPERRIENQMPCAEKGRVDNQRFSWPSFRGLGLRICKSVCLCREELQLACVERMRIN